MTYTMYCAQYCTSLKRAAHGELCLMIILNTKSVYKYFKMWSKPDITGRSLLDKLLADLVIMERLSHDRNPKPTMLIVDSKSIQNADTAQTKGYDAGKNSRRENTYGC